MVINIILNSLFIDLYSNYPKEWFINLATLILKTLEISLAVILIAEFKLDISNSTIFFTLSLYFNLAATFAPSARFMGIKLNETICMVIFVVTNISLACFLTYMKKSSTKDSLLTVVQEKDTYTNYKGETIETIKKKYPVILIPVIVATITSLGVVIVALLSRAG